MKNIIVNPNSITINKTGSWRVFKPKTNFKKCVSCGMCAKICPENCIKMIKKRSILKPKTDYNYCKGCGMCAVECRVHAIEMRIDKDI
ncbi:4Fe-4S binding protein [Patescibacteria group bacterium]|nr:4Fe-4S binding protein [Patescibacteria group bacterium]